MLKGYNTHTHRPLSVIRHQPLSLNNANSTSSARRRSLAIVNSLRAFSNISCVATLLDYTHWLALIMHSATHATLAGLAGWMVTLERGNCVCKFALLLLAERTPKGSPCKVHRRPPVSSSAHNLIHCEYFVAANGDCDSEENCQIWLKSALLINHTLLVTVRLGFSHLNTKWVTYK